MVCMQATMQQLVCAAASPAPLLVVDLGSEFLKVAIASLHPSAKAQQQWRREVVVNEISKRKTSALVGFRPIKPPPLDTATPAYERVLGEEAAALLQRHPATVVARARDLLGVRADAAWLAEMAEEHGLQFGIAPYADRSGLAAVRRGDDGGATHAPEELVASLLQYALGIAQAQVSSSSSKSKAITRALLAVPAFWGQARRQALADAAALAGLRVEGVVSSHAGAAAQYGVERYDPTLGTQHVVLYDMGSGSTEVALVRYSSYLQRSSTSGKIERIPQGEVLGVEWDDSLGSNLLDMALVRHFASRFESDHGLPTGEVLGSPRAFARLKQAARRTKEMLSANSAAPVIVEELHGGKDLRGSITRPEFEALSPRFFERAAAPLARLLARAGLKVSDLDLVELLGGGTRVPGVQAALSAALSGRHLDRHLDSDEAVVLGSCLLAANMTGRPALRFGLSDAVLFGVRLLLNEDDGGSGSCGVEAFGSGGCGDSCGVEPAGGDEVGDARRQGEDEGQVESADGGGDGEEAEGDEGADAGGGEGAGNGGLNGGDADDEADPADDDGDADGDGYGGEEGVEGQEEEEDEARPELGADPGVGVDPNAGVDEPTPKPGPGEPGPDRASSVLPKVLGRSVLRAGRLLPMARTLTLRGVTDDPLRVRLVYDVGTGHGLPPGVASPLFGSFEIAGFGRVLQKYGAASADVLLSFEADSGGQLSLVKAEAAVETARADGGGPSSGLKRVACRVEPSPGWSHPVLMGVQLAAAQAALSAWDAADATRAADGAARSALEAYAAEASEALQLGGDSGGGGEEDGGVGGVGGGGGGGGEGSGGGGAGGEGGGGGEEGGVFGRGGEGSHGKAGVGSLSGGGGGGGAEGGGWRRFAGDGAVGALTRALAETEEWLHLGDGGRAGAAECRSRLRALKRLGEPMRRRAAEATARAEALPRLRADAGSKLSLLAQWEDSRMGAAALGSRVTSFLARLDAKEAVQAGAPSHEEPLFSVEDVLLEWSGLVRAFEALESQGRAGAGGEVSLPAGKGGSKGGGSKAGKKKGGGSKGGGGGKSQKGGEGSKNGSVGNSGGSGSGGKSTKSSSGGKSSGGKGDSGSKHGGGSSGSAAKPDKAGSSPSKAKDSKPKPPGSAKQAKAPPVSDTGRAAGEARESQERGETDGWRRDEL
ncbi:hypothetical protein FOA52_001792 [Chlamydomonas sp. UWO 241]|nr:hypothetical protein FOA52_001792 [Chlamydomonas sp. UWO 241]